MKSNKRKDGSVSVDFDNPRGYYAHSIREIGNPTDRPGIDSMWAWINHLREKNWWGMSLENRFKKEVQQYFV